MLVDFAEVPKAEVMEAELLVVTLAALEGEMEAACINRVA